MASQEISVNADLPGYGAVGILKTRQVLKFALVGAATASIDYLALYLLTARLRFPYLLSAAIGFMLGSTCNYFISVNWVFIPGKFKPQIEFSLFLITSIVGLLVNESVMWFLVDRQRLHYLYAKAGAIALVSMLNFVMKKKLVFID